MAGRKIYGMTELTRYLQPTKHALDEFCEYAYGFNASNPQISTYDLGDDCSRRAWYRRNGEGSKPFSPDMLRYIESNRHAKDTVIGMLEALDMRIWDKNKYLQFSDSKGKSKIDGLIEGVKEAPTATHLLSVRPVRQKAFADIQKNGVPKKDNIKIQVDMRLLGLNRCLYIAVNRNTDELHVERVKADIKFADAQLNKADRIVQLNTPPGRIGNGKPSWYQCKTCDLKDICFGTHDLDHDTNTNEQENIWKQHND